MVVPRAQAGFAECDQQEAFGLGQPDGKLHRVLLPVYRLAAIVHNADLMPLTIRTDCHDLELGETRRDRRRRGQDAMGIPVRGQQQERMPTGVADDDRAFTFSQGSSTAGHQQVLRVGPEGDVAAGAAERQSTARPQRPAPPAGGDSRDDDRRRCRIRYPSCDHAFPPPLSCQPPDERNCEKACRLSSPGHGPR